LIKFGFTLGVEMNRLRLGAANPMQRTMVTPE